MSVPSFNVFFPFEPSEPSSSATLASFSGWKTSLLEVKLPLHLATDPSAISELRGVASWILDARFRGLAHPVPYSQNAEAVCARGRLHQPPHSECDCGFYATRERSAILSSQFPGSHLADGSNLLGVYLYGEVVEGRKGFRASRQKVVSIEVSPFCAEEGCGGETERLALVPAPVAFDTNGAWFRLTPRCPDHAPVASLSLPEVSLVYGVEASSGDSAEWVAAARTSTGAHLSRTQGLAPLAPRALKWVFAGLVGGATSLALWFSAGAPGAFSNVPLWGSLGVLFTYLSLMILLVTGLSRLVDVTSTGRPPAKIRTAALPGLLLVLALSGFMILNLALINADPTAPAPMPSPKEVFDETAADVAAVLSGSLATVSFDTQTLNEALWGDGEASDLRDPSGPYLSVEVIGDRVVLSTASGSWCLHRGINARGETVFEGRSPRWGGACLFRPGPQTVISHPDATPALTPLLRDGLNLPN